jgi:hypothetical protein
MKEHKLVLVAHQSLGGHAMSRIEHYIEFPISRAHIQEVKVYRRDDPLLRGLSTDVSLLDGYVGTLQSLKLVNLNDIPDVTLTQRPIKNAKRYFRPLFQELTCNAEDMCEGMSFFFASKRKDEPVSYKTPFGSSGKRYEAVDINRLFSFRQSVGSQNSRLTAA